MKKTFLRLLSLVCVVAMFASSASASAVSISESRNTGLAMETLLQNAKEVETYYTASGTKITVAVVSVGTSVSPLGWTDDGHFIPDEPIKSDSQEFSCTAKKGNHLYAVTYNITEKDYDMKVTYSIAGLDEPVTISKQISPDDRLVLNIDSEDETKGLTCTLTTTIKSLSTVKPVLYDYYAEQYWI